VFDFVVEANRNGVAGFFSESDHEKCGRFVLDTNGHDYSLQNDHGELFVAFQVP